MSLNSGISLPVYTRNMIICKCFAWRASFRSFFCNLHDSRISLFIRLRSTAFLKYRDGTPAPNCNEPLWGSEETRNDALSGNTLKWFPWWNSRSICFLLFSLSPADKVNCFKAVKVSKQKASGKWFYRRLYPKNKNLLFQSPLIRHCQLMTAFATTACENLTSVGSFHAFAETMYRFTAFAMRLECTFHDFSFFTLLEINPGEAGSCLDCRGSPYPLVFVKGRQR